MNAPDEHDAPDERSADSASPVNRPGGAIVRNWVAGRVPPEAAVLLERLARSDDVIRLAVMPDVHLAGEVCVGTVLATWTLVYPNAVGGDIGCGMAALAFDADGDVLADERAAARVLAGLYAAVPTNRHPGARPLPADLVSAGLSDDRLTTLMRRDGAVQLGTLGRGNHFLEFQRDADGRLWLMVHSGSRTMGQAIRDLHLRSRRTHAGFACLDSTSDAGRAYLADAAWAVRYAAANRRAMADAAAAVMKRSLGVDAAMATFIDIDHNHVRSETHFGQPMWIHRKGATPAAQGTPGLIPGSMGTCSYHVQGRGCAQSLNSSSHGAGRTMSRQDARRRIGLAAFRRQMNGIWYDHRLSDRLRDEAPAAYKDIDTVMEAQRELTGVVRRVRPVLIYKV